MKLTNDLDADGNNISNPGTVDGRDVATDGSKLDGIEGGATADQTASEILTAIKTVDGAGSGLDADTLDTLSSASFVQTSGNQTVAGVKTFSSFPVTPSSAPTTDYQVANKKYVDDYFSNYGRGFFAKMSSNQTIATNTTTLLYFNTDSGGLNFDTHGEFHNTGQLYLYKPQLAGKYIVNLIVPYSTTGLGSYYATIAKNGTSIGYTKIYSAGGSSVTPSVSIIVVMNGTTDYIGGYSRHITGSNATVYSADASFSAYYLGA